MNAVFYGHLLLVTVLIQTIQGRLDLYHAIFVMHMLVCLSVFQACGMRCVPMRICRYSSETGIKTSIAAWRYSLRRRITLTFQLFQVLFIFPSWALYVWIKGSAFGSQPQCSHLIKYVLLFVNIRVTVHWLRIMFIAFISLTIWMSLIALRMMLNSPLTESGASIGESVRRVRVGLGWYLPFFYLSSTTLCVPFNIFVSNNNPNSPPRLAVYGVVTAELIVCGVPSQVRVERCTHPKPHRFTEITHLSKPGRILGALAKLFLSCCYYPSLSSYWSLLQDGILAGVDARGEQIRRHKKRHEKRHKQKATLWNWSNSTSPNIK